MSASIFATGVAKKVALAEETTFGVNPITGGVYLRRVSSDLSLNKDSYESQEILVSQQIRDARHGVRRPQGTFAGQISPGSFNHFWEGLLRSNFTAGVNLPGVSLTLDTTAGTLTGTGFNADGLKREDIFRLSGITGGNTVLNGVNLRINTLSDTVITSRDLIGFVGATSGALAGTVDLAVVGKKLFIPASGQLLKSYTIEHFFSDVSISEAFLGCRFGQTSVALPATGLVTFTSQIMGQNMVQTTAQQLTAPSGPSSSMSLAAVNGKMTYNNVDLADVTGLNLQISPEIEANPVIGSNIVPWIFLGRLRVTGSFTALFTDETIANSFYNELVVGLSVYLTAGTLGTSDFMRFTLPAVKLMSATKSDGSMSLVQSFTFTALENTLDTEIDLSTIIIQDSLA